VTAAHIAVSGGAGTAAVAAAYFGVRLAKTIIHVVTALAVVLGLTILAVLLAAGGVRLP
jgi:hypothetical protein